MAIYSFDTYIRIYNIIILELLYWIELYLKLSICCVYMPAVVEFKQLNYNYAFRYSFTYIECSSAAQISQMFPGGTPSIQSDLFTTPLLIVLPYTSIQSDLFTTPLLIVLPYVYTSIQSDLFTTPLLIVLPYTSIQSDLFTTSPLVVLPYTRIQSHLALTSSLLVVQYISIQLKSFITPPLVLYPYYDYTTGPIVLGSSSPHPRQCFGYN